MRLRPALHGSCERRRTERTVTCGRRVMNPRCYYVPTPPHALQPYILHLIHLHVLTYAVHQPPHTHSTSYILHVVTTPTPTRTLRADETRPDAAPRPGRRARATGGAAELPLATPRPRHTHHTQLHITASRISRERAQTRPSRRGAHARAVRWNDGTTVRWHDGTTARRHEGTRAACTMVRW